MKLIELTKLKFIKQGFPINTFLIEEYRIWVNVDTICHLEYIPDPSDEDQPYITRITFNFGSHNMTPGMEIKVAESPEQIKALIRNESRND